jgi:TolA-binding protein
MRPFHQPIPAYAAGLSLALFLLVSSGCAPQATAPQLANKLDILEKRVVVLEQQKLKTLADLREEVAKFKEKASQELEAFRKSQQFFIDELNTLKSDLAINTNDNELAQHNIRKNSARIDALNKRIGDQAIALQELQKFFEASIDIPAEKQSKDQADFEEAFKLYRARNFKQAEQHFIQHRKNYPKSDLVDDSLFFIANMAFLQGDYNSATLRLFELLKQYPKSNRKNDAKWLLGVSLERSGDLNGALDLYRELMNLEPNNPLRIKAQFRLEELAPTE